MVQFYHFVHTFLSQRLRQMRCQGYEENSLSTGCFFFFCAKERVTLDTSLSLTLALAFCSSFIELQKRGTYLMRPSAAWTYWAIEEFLERNAYEIKEKPALSISGIV